MPYLSRAAVITDGRSVTTLRAYSAQATFSQVKSLRTCLLDSVSDSLLSTTFNFSRVPFNRTSKKKTLDVDSGRQATRLIITFVRPVARAKG